MAKAKKMLSLALAVLVTVGSMGLAPASAATKKVDYYQIALTNINKYLKPQLTITKQSQSEEDLKLLQSYYRSLKIHMSKITDAKKKAAISKQLMELSAEVVAVRNQVNANIAAADAVEAYELAAIETLVDIAKAEELELVARDKVQDVSDRTIRVALLSRIDQKKANVEARKAALAPKPEEKPVGVEAASKIEASVIGSIPGYANTVLAENKALVQAKVTDKDGKPVLGATVVFTKEEANNDANFEGLTVVQTDSNGIATAVLSTPTKALGSVKFKATVAGKNLASEGIVKFATVGIQELAVDGDKTDTTDDSIYPSTNALSTEYDNAIRTRRINENEYTKYVASQQVSKTGTTDRAVVFVTKPVLNLPSEPGETKVDYYKQEINESSGELHPYAYWSKTYTVPAGLKYATLKIAKLQLPKYSKLTVLTTDVDGATIDKVEITGPYDDSNFGIQIPVQTTSSVKVKVTLQTPGQVNLNLNDGIEIASIEGVYKNATAKVAETVVLPNAKISWEKVNVVYSDYKKLNNALDYIGNNNGYNSAYTYYYRVPVFPFTGNAIIVGKDANGVIKQYYLFPTVNGESADKENINVLADPNVYKAILVTEKEALTATGTIEQTENGDKLTVNSTEVGYTAIKGSIIAPELKLDATNNTIYTSVHWAPRPTSVAVTSSKTFYTFVGQKVTAIAQLVDENGNPVSQANVGITWSYSNYDNDGNTADNTDNLPVTEVKKDTITDVNGQAKIEFTTGNTDKITNLTAQPPTGYKVVIKIGDSVVEKANIKWVKAGLYFDPTLEIGDHTGPVYGNVLTATTGSAVNVGDYMEYGYQVKAIDVDGVELKVSNVDVTFRTESGSVGTMTAGSNGIFKATSNVAGLMRVEGTMGVVANDAIFTVTNSDGTTTTYKNVGTGNTSLFSKLILPVSFGVVGQQATFVTPFGTNLSKTLANTTLYVKVTDKFGNAIAGKNISYTITGNGATTGSAITTNEGIAPITVNSNNTTGQSIVTVNVDDQTISTTINWMDTSSIVAFDLVNAGLNATGTNDVIALTFTRPVNPNTVNIKQFTIKDQNNVAYGIKDVRVAENIVYLTLADANAHLPQTTQAAYTISINSYTADGITYTLADAYGRTSANSYINLVVPTAIDLTATLNGTTLTVTVKNANSPVNGAVVKAVSTDLNAFQANGNGITTATTDANGVATITLNQATQNSIITIYYNGQEYTVQVR